MVRRVGHQPYFTGKKICAQDMCGLSQKLFLSTDQIQDFIKQTPKVLAHSYQFCNRVVLSKTFQ